MARAIPTTEPTQVTAGDLLTWTHTSSDFTSAVATLSYQIIGPDKLPWDPTWVTVDGSGWLVEIPTSATTGLIGGSYKVWRTLTTADDVVTVPLPNLSIQANPALLTTTKTADETLLEEVDKAIAAFISGGAIKMYMVGGRQVMREELSDLRALRVDLVNRIQNARRRASGGGFGTPIRFRMTVAS